MKKTLRICVTVYTQYRRVSDKQTDTKWVSFARRVFMQRLMGELGPPNLPKFSHMYTIHDASSRAIKRVIPSRHVAFGGLNDVPLNFGSKTSKN